MAQKFLVPIDLGNNEIRNVLVQALASAPSSPLESRLYYDTTLHQLGYYNGTTWIYAAAGGVTGVTGTAPIQSTGGTTPVISIVAASNITANQVTGLAAPSGSSDAANKAYVDAVASGLDVKASVRAATTANITLSGTQTIDGVACIAGDRVLVKDQSTGANNGIYVVAAGAWSRATDADSSAEVTSGMFTFVTEGTANGNNGFVLTTDDPITLGTTALVFAQFSGAGQITAGTGLTKAGNTLAIDTASGYGVRKYATTIGDGSTTAIVITHSLGSRDVQVQVYTNGSPYDTVYPDVERTSTTTATIRFTTAPTTNQYAVVVTG
jgi:hypothetical protein